MSTRKSFIHVLIFPQEVQWNDIDYMDFYNMFTYGKANFSDLPKFIEKIHKSGRRYVMIFVSTWSKAFTYIR